MGVLAIMLTESVKKMKQAEIIITNTSMADEIHAALLKGQAKLLYDCLMDTVTSLYENGSNMHWEDLLNQANDLNAVLNILSDYEPTENWHRGPDDLDSGEFELVAIIRDQKTKKKSRKKKTPKDRALDRIGGKKK